MIAETIICVTLLIASYATYLHPRSNSMYFGMQAWFMDAWAIINGVILGYVSFKIKTSHWIHLYIFTVAAWYGLMHFAKLTIKLYKARIERIKKDARKEHFIANTSTIIADSDD